MHMLKNSSNLMFSGVSMQPKNFIAPLEAAISLVVINVYGTTSRQLRDYLGHGAVVSEPNSVFGSALELIEKTRLGDSIIWINAEGLSLDELALLERRWLSRSDKALMLLDSNQASIVSRSLQGLVSAHRDNAAFQAAILTVPDAQIASKTSRTMAAQSRGWLRHEMNHSDNIHASHESAMNWLGFKSTLQDKPQPSLLVGGTTMTSLPKSAASDDPQLASSTEPSPVVGHESLHSASESLAHTALSPTPLSSKGSQKMTTLNDSMNACMQIDGAIAAALVDISSGMALAKVGSGVNLDIAAAGNTEVMKAKMKVMAGLGLNDTIEDMLITLGTQYHLIRPIPRLQGLFLYLVLDKPKSNLAMARFKLMTVEKDITV
jgi:hypothetical protein